VILGHELRILNICIWRSHDRARERLATDLDAVDEAATVIHNETLRLALFYAMVLLAWLYIGGVRL